MRSPNEKIECYKSKVDKVKDSVDSYVSKFMHKKYDSLNIGVYDYNVRINHYDGIVYPVKVELHLEKGVDYPIKIEILYNGKTFFSSIDAFNHGCTITSHDAKYTFENIKSSLMAEYSHEDEAAILYFAKVENIKSISEYALQIYNLIYCTTYIYCLPKAYTFLLCNNKNKIFPKDIAKLITHKILFASDASHPRCPELVP